MSSNNKTFNLPQGFTKLLVQGASNAMHSQTIELTGSALSNSITLTSAARSSGSATTTVPMTVSTDGPQINDLVAIVEGISATDTFTVALSYTPSGGSATASSGVKFETYRLGQPTTNAPVVAQVFSSDDTGTHLDYNDAQLFLSYLP